jgi:hypothetical protein
MFHILGRSARVDVAASGAHNGASFAPGPPANVVEIRSMVVELFSSDAQRLGASMARRGRLA